MITVREINSIEELAALRGAWEELLAQTPRGSFLRTFDWLEVYWRHYGDDQKLRVLVVSEDNQVVGIVPLVVRPTKTKVGWLNYLTYPNDDWGTFYGPIGARVEFTLTHALKHILASRRDWDIIELRNVDTAGADDGQTQRAFDAVGLRKYERMWMPAVLIDVSMSYDEYMKGRKKSWRKSWKKNERTLAAQGELRHVRYRPRGDEFGEGDPRWDLYEHCVEIAGQSWQGASTTGTTISHDSVQDFLRDVHEVACRRGAIDMNVLYLDDRPVAFDYNYHYRGYIDALRTGYNVDGAGTVLLWKIIEDSCGRDDYAIDLGADFIGCKRRWASTVLASYRYTHFGCRQLRAQLLHANRWAQETFLKKTRDFELPIEDEEGLPSGVTVEL